MPHTCLFCKSSTAVVFSGKKIAFQQCATYQLAHNGEQMFDDTTGTVPVPSTGHFRLIYFQIKHTEAIKIKHTEAILSNSTRKLLWSEITEILIAV